MKIFFQTKEESNRQQQQDFLKLSPSMRVISFYRTMERLRKFPTKNTIKKDNFMIVING